MAENTPITPYELEKSPLDLAGERLGRVEHSSVTVGRLDSIDLLPLVDEGDVTKGHGRSDSTLSAVMGFPIPPDRVTLRVTYGEGVGSPVGSAVEGQEIPLEILLDTPIPTEGAFTGYQSNEEDLVAPDSPKLQEFVERFRVRRSLSRRISGEDSEEGSDLGEYATLSRRS
jgi:hypothetical protein